MLARPFLALAALAVLTPALFANPNGKSIKTGDEVAITLTGDAAQKYAERIMPRAPADLELSVMGTVTRIGADGRARIEHSASVKRAGQVDRLVTLVAEIDEGQLAPRTIPAGTPVFSSPVDSEPTSTKENAEILTLQISDMKGVKLRIWTLAEEIGG